MKLFFLETDTLYKIFKTIEKVPSHKKITIYIEHGNDFFDNPRRAKQLQDIFDKKKIQATFTAKTHDEKEYYKQMGLTYTYKGKKKRLETLQTLYLFFFNFKKFHYNIYQKKHFASYLIFIIEIIIVAIILYILYILIIPSSTLYITPEYEVEEIIYSFQYYPYNQASKVSQNNNQLSIPYHRGSISYTYPLKTNVSNIISKQKPANGNIVVYNTTKQKYDIVKNTQFITDNGLVFRSTKPFVIPEGHKDTPSTTQIEVIADGLDIYKNIIGERGNIKANTVMYIKNLKDSYFLKKIYATNPKKFTGGETINKGSISKQDMQYIKKELTEYVQTHKENIVREHFDLSNSIVLPFPELISVKTEDIKIDDKIGDIKTQISGSIKTTLTVPYIKEEDIIRAVLNYLTQRKTNTQKLINIDTQSIIFYPIKKQENNILTIPTSINTIFGYDFNHDTNHIKTKIKNEISGKGIKQATNILLSYPEIAAVKIKTQPPRYSQIPITKSRILFKVK